MNRPTTLLAPKLPATGRETLRWGRLYGCARGLAIAEAAAGAGRLTLLVTADSQSAYRLEQELRFFGEAADLPILSFPDWETLPYDVFSPHEDIISQRLETLHRLPSLGQGVLVVPVTTLMHRIAPRDFLSAHTLMMDVGERLDIDALRQRLEQAGYRHVSQVMEHGEFALRGSIVDLFPMGANHPYRIDLFDDEIESIREFDPETQLSQEKVERIRLLPAHEFPMHDEAIKGFRQRYRQLFEGDPQASSIYREVSNGSAPAGVEYYIPLFFERMATLFDYLPEDALVITTADVEAAASRFAASTADRYEQRRHDVQRPLLPPSELFLSPEELAAGLARESRVLIEGFEIEDGGSGVQNFASLALPGLLLQARAEDPAATLKSFIASRPGRLLFVAESAGRREHLIEALRQFEIFPRTVDSWPDFVASELDYAITVAPMESGVRLPGAGINIIPESALFGQRAQQERRRKRPTRDADAVVRNLTDLNVGAPVVHEEHGVGRYIGLQKLAVGGSEAEFLTLEYAGGDKLYVPVASLHLISRYTGTAPEDAPLHKLGSDQWQKARRRAAEKIHDVAAELLDINARRAARRGHAFATDTDEYAAFAASFPFEETPDQEKAIQAVLDDMAAERPMDRVVCGDVGFGKTEVAMRAAFVAASGGKQVAVLVPTTLLAQQHLQNFRDRFADWPIRIEGLSRFRSQKQHKETLAGIAAGTVDIVIGTHKLLQGDVAFKDLGLIIVDEEHRFGVRDKEKLKNLRAEVDILTLTATPIPRTLNMSLSGLRDLSIIATPPVQRHAIKTFVNEWNDALLQEAVLREVRRGGQVYFLHNEVQTIEKMAQRIEQVVPDISIRIAHGQMRERELEEVMLDFYHQRFNLLLCTTIVESGIDVPTANTIIINRADKLGLSQLHQLRGRVGRSHHRAYAYLVTPPRVAMTPDAVKRLEAIESLEDLGVGFTLATHDLEIRGAGELLGDEQSGQIQEIGFTLYNELLERAVKALKSGKRPELDKPLHSGAEIDLGVPALLPDDYVPDIHARLVLYKRIASAENEEALRELQVEMIDRFGLLPDAAKALFEVNRVKLKAEALGVKKLDVGEQGGRIIFNATPNIDPASVIRLIQSDPQRYRLDGQDKLRFTLSLENLQKRVDTVERLLGELALKDAA
ncbi:MAG: transcription-repair coupling factor [Gammaproteobacteria bacterium]|nr:transcription-repair coupling factor [Gammaproteobacteria bacterium]MDX5374275.1 transcription-repair coupling factor [Gammaproteobacteria bacterium]